MGYSEKDFRRFINGKLSQQEAVDFLNWIESKEGESQFGAWVKESWQKELNDTPLKSKAEQIQPCIGMSSPSQNKKFKQWQLWAASISFFLFASIFLFFNLESDLPEEFKTEITATEIIKSAPKGVKTKIQLPDGSSVYLNSESSITYLTDFADKRTIQLNGEAFFEVKSNPSNPFTVITGPLSTVALGTSFNIKAYDEEEDIQVSLATGKISVSNDFHGNEILISPGEGLEFDKSSKKMEKAHIDISKVLHWKNGILHFEKESIEQVIKTLERWYDVEFEIRGNKKWPKDKCSGEFGPHEYLSNVLQVLSHSVKFEYTIINKKVILEFK